MPKGKKTTKRAPVKRAPKAASPDPALVETNNRVLEALQTWTQELARNTAALIQLTASMNAKSTRAPRAAAATPPVPTIPAGDTVATAAPTPAAPPPAPVATKEPKPAPRPCKGCGMNLDDPTDKHSAGCTEVKANGKKKSPEELLEEAKGLFLAYAQSSGREAAVALLGKFGGAKLSELPVEKLPEFVAWLAAQKAA